MFKQRAIFILIIFVNSEIISQPVSSIQNKIDNLLSADFFQSTLIACDIYDLTKGGILYQKNHKMLLHPASNMKILTSAAGLLFLGPDYKFKTSLYYSGQIINGTLYGDLYIVGGFDPDFISSDLDSLVNIIFLTGIKEITGDIIGDISSKDSIFWGNGWMWDDDPSTDAPYLSALNINDNAVGVFVKGVNLGDTAEISIKPQTNFVNIINSAVTISPFDKDSLYIDRDWINRKNTVIVKGTVNQTFSTDKVPREVKLNLFEPEKYFLTLFIEALDSAGIKTKSEFKFSVKPDYAVHLFSFERGYDSVMVNLNKTSDNLSAEMILYAMAAEHFDLPASAHNGLKLIDSLIILAGLNPENYRFVDGSGVSRYNLVTAEMLLNLLKYLYYQQSDLYLVLYNSFPIAGVDGTLEDRMIGTAAENNVHAKTGTLSGVSALSGYLTADSGNVIAFSIMVQNYTAESSAARYYIDEICKILAEE